MNKLSIFLIFILIFLPIEKTLAFSDSLYGNYFVPECEIRKIIKSFVSTIHNNSGLVHGVDYSIKKVNNRLIYFQSNIFLMRINLFNNNGLNFGLQRGFLILYFDYNIGYVILDSVSSNHALLLFPEISYQIKLSNLID